MRRVKKHKVKQEQPEASSSLRGDVERDLTYHIHDRVELMHQVFSVLKPKEIKAMAPQCVQYISLSDLQELCTEELLGISSKRLCAILDGAEPPSDTESSSTSSSPEKLETISLDSISSDEEILSVGSSKKKKHKHRRHATKSKSKHKRNSSSEKSEDENDRSKASRAGLTVLELLELQARARAIRAQLQQEQAVDVTDLTVAPREHRVSDDEVEIKEEPAEVVEISSEDEKPNLKDLQKEIELSSKNSKESSNPETQTVTKRINDLIITVPQTKATRKIKLNRNKPPTLIKNPNEDNTNDKSNTEQPDKEVKETTVKENENEVLPKNIEDKNKTPNKHEEISTEKPEPSKKKVPKDKQKKKQMKKGKQKSSKKDGSDHDEITLELSDSEKMDLLEDLDRKNLDNVSSSCTEESERSSDSENEIESSRHKSATKNIETPKSKTEIDSVASNENEKDKVTEFYLIHRVDENIENAEVTSKETTEVITDERNNKNDEQKDVDDDQADNNEVIEVTTLDDIPIRNDSSTVQEVSETLQSCSIVEKSCDETTDDCIPSKDDGDRSETAAKVMNRDLSEGELSDRESSEVEASDVKPEVVCISDDEISSKKSHKKKKNKKKEKKSKKEKRTKKSPDFRKDADQNFFKESSADDNLTQTQTDNATETITLEDDDIYEILELSSDSSCNEDNGTVLSKEPTAEEIEALSAKIDEIEREDVVTEEQIREHERLEAEKRTEVDPENISWKDRYLDSKKVKNVLTTSNIFNAIRKKNKELKRKLEEAKKEAAVVRTEVENNSNANLEEGSIEHYNTLEGSTKYVDPVREENEEDKKEVEEAQVTKEMKKDAKQLLKMFKKLLKYNEMNRQSNPNKRKKKKQKKNKEDKSRTVTNT